LSVPKEVSSSLFIGGGFLPLFGRVSGAPAQFLLQSWEVPRENIGSYASKKDVEEGKIVRIQRYIAGKNFRWTFLFYFFNVGSLAITQREMLYSPIFFPPKLVSK
jgi:hypothetical protein